MTELVCVECPRGCRLKVESDGEKITVAGNMCRKGETFAAAELTDPRRTFSALVRTVFPDCPVLPVRVDRPIRKGDIFSVLKLINALLVSAPVRTGDILIADAFGTGANVIACAGAGQ